MYEWSRVIFAKKSKFHGAGGPDTVVLPIFKFEGTLMNMRGMRCTAQLRKIIMLEVRIQ